MQRRLAWNSGAAAASALRKAAAAGDDDAKAELYRREGRATQPGPGL